MVYEIIDVGEEVSKKKRLYLLVKFWETEEAKDSGEDPIMTEDFYLDIPEEYKEPHVRPSGWWEDLDGNPVYPYTEVNGQWVHRSLDGIKTVTKQIPIADEALKFIDNWTQTVRKRPEAFYNNHSVDNSRRTVRTGKGGRSDVKSLVGKVRKAPPASLELPNRGQ
jgi:hypothetical protein